MYLIDLEKFLGSTAIVSNSIPVGVGYAFSKKLKNQIQGLYFPWRCGGGVFYESANFAA